MLNDPDDFDIPDDPAWDRPAKVAPMPQVKRSTTTQPTAAATPPPAPKPTTIQPRMGLARPMPTALPLMPRKPTYNINRHPMLITGKAGAGKTTFGTQEPGVLNLSFDPPNDTYGIIQEHVLTWAEMLAWVQLLEQQAFACAASGEPFPYRRVQIDGGGTMSRVCTEWTCLNKLGGVTHPNDVEYGKGSDIVNQQFTGVVDRLLALPCGTWFIAHEKIKTVKMEDGSEIERVSPDIRGQMEGILVGRCHIVTNIQYYPGTKKRVARIRGDDNYTAKCNIEGRFLTTDGRRVEEVYLGEEGPQKAWERFMRAFNNQQGWATVQEMVNKNKPAAQQAPPAKPAEDDEPPLD